MTHPKCRKRHSKKKTKRTNILEVTVNINREIIVAQLHAVRTKPKGKNCAIEKDTMCTYNIVYQNEVVGTMTGAYGCGIDLAIKLLEKFKEHGHIYKFIAMDRMIEKRERKKDAI